MSNIQYCNLCKLSLNKKNIKKHNLKKAHQKKIFIWCYDCFDYVSKYEHDKKHKKKHDKKHDYGISKLNEKFEKLNNCYIDPSKCFIEYNCKVLNEYDYKVKNTGKL